MKTLVQLRSNMNITALDHNFSHLINVAQASTNKSHMVGFKRLKTQKLLLKTSSTYIWSRLRPV